MEKKQDIDLFENIFRKVPYLMGFLWAKANKMKNKTAVLFKNAKVTVAEMIESFKNGFESVKGEIDNEAAQKAKSELKDINYEPEFEKTTSDNESKKSRAEVNTGIGDIKNEQGLQQESQRIKELPEGLLDVDLEKEIGEIDKEVAEI